MQPLSSVMYLEENVSFLYFFKIDTLLKAHVHFLISCSLFWLEVGSLYSHFTDEKSKASRDYGIHLESLTLCCWPVTYVLSFMSYTICNVLYFIIKSSNDMTGLT